MAGQRTLPGLGLTGFWDLGDNTYKPTMDANLRLLSALVQPRILSILAAAPGSPTDGDIHLASAAWGGGFSQDIMIHDDAAWVAVTPVSGWKAYDVATGLDMVFDGSAWVDAAPGVLITTDGATDRVLSDADLAGNVIIERNAAAPQTVTVNTGLAGAEPVTIINTGGGALTFQGTATINSAGGNVAVNTQYASVTLIPVGSDVYHLVGALE